MQKILGLMVAASLTALAMGATLAQVNPEEKAKTGQTQGQGQQPQGNPGNLQTKPGEAPASSPQGETPGGMQSAPKGATKSNDKK